MREIIFRGKRISNGEWEFGDLWRHPYGKPDICIANPINGNGSMGGRTVDPATVGQFTGLTDKNGKRIFEGDVVDFYFFDKGSKNTKTMLIEWRDEGFGMRELFRDYRLADDFSIIKEKIFTYRGDIRNGVYKSNMTYFIEVIGNIYDNPELLTE